VFLYWPLSFFFVRSTLTTGGQERGHGVVDVPELGVPVGVGTVPHGPKLGYFTTSPNHR